MAEIQENTRKAMKCMQFEAAHNEREDRFQGRQDRLTDVHGEVVEPVLA